MKTYKDSVSPTVTHLDGQFELLVNNNAGTFQIMLETNEVFTQGYIIVQAETRNGVVETVYTNFGNSSTIQMVNPQIVIVDGFNIRSFWFTPVNIDENLGYNIKILNLEYGT